MTIEAVRESVAPAPSRSGTAPWRRVVSVGWPYAAAIAIVTAVALWTYTPWRADGAIVWPTGDSLAFHTWIQTIADFGWYETNPQLGAPFGQNSHNYAVTDEFLFFFIGKVLVPVAGSVGGAVLLYVVLGFPLAAAAAVGAARYFGASRGAAVVVGVAFALLPDHFFRATGHYSLSSQWAIPIVVIAAGSLLRTSPLRRFGEIAVLTGCVVVSLTNAYYTVFGAILVAGCGVLAMLGAGSVRRAARSAVRTALRGTALAVPLVLAYLVDAQRASSPLGFASTAITRAPGDSETWAGRITAMLLPTPAHRFELFRDVRNRYLSTFGLAAENPTLALTATVGFLLLVVWSLHVLASSGRVRSTRLGPLATLNWLAILMFTVGGVGSAWALLLEGGGIRVWSRAHLVIALVSLVALAIMVDLVRRPALRAALVLGLLAVVLVDQTSPQFRPDITAAKDVRAEVEALTGEIEDVSGASAQVYQMPQVGFPLPDRDTGPVSSYDGFLPYLYGGAQGWAFGGYQGDPKADWQQALSAEELGRQLSGLSAVGFDGVLVDTLVPTGSELATELERLTGGTDAESTSGRWRYFSLDSVLACSGPDAEELADATARPPLLYPGEGFSARFNLWSSFDDRTELRLLTLRPEGWPRASLTLQVVSIDSTFDVTFPDGSRQRLGPGDDTVEWQGPLEDEEEIVTLERTSGEGSYDLGTRTARAIVSDGVAACAAAPGTDEGSGS